MAMRIALLLLLVLALATPALGDDVGKKNAVDAKIAALHGKLTVQKQRESTLRGQIADVTSRIRDLEARVGDVSLQLKTLEQDLALHQERLEKLTALFRLQTRRYTLLKEQYRLAILRLDNRLVAIYESPEPSTIDVLLGAASIQDAIDKVTYLNQIGAADRQIAREVARSKRDVRVARAHTAELRANLLGETSAIAARTAQTRDARDELVGARNDLSSTKEQQVVALSQLTAEEQAAASEIDALQEVSVDLGNKIRAAQARSSGSGGTAGVASGSGALAWPVSGPITSPFGWRWGRMHQGIDIGVPYGTPIHAAAAGTVIYCGWEEGYGNLVVLDHGGNLATAYAHQSSIAVACGQQVAQGDVIGYVGCTGHCTGPHLHFEVRINGNPVDPLGYL
jgi:murein DD-endopeptidase MepM/ murein hydrolase activator NlpD